MVIVLNDEVLGILAHRAVIVPTPQVERRVDVLDLLSRFMVGNLVEHGVLAEPQLRVKTDSLVSQELCAVHLSVDKHKVLAPAVDAPGSVSRFLLLDERAVQEIKSFLHCAEHKMESVVVEESVIAIAEHDVLRLGVVNTVVACVG